MRLYALSGQRQQALRQFETLREVLADELDVEPEPESQQLFEQIRAGEIGPLQAGAGQIDREQPVRRDHQRPELGLAQVRAIEPRPRQSRPSQIRALQVGGAKIGVLEMRAKARRLKAEHDLHMLVIDYVQLMQGRGRFENRQQELTSISRSLKALAKELGVPVLLLSQLSRAPDARADHRPMLSDLRESGALEQDADVVMFIYREDRYKEPEAEDTNIAEIIIAKQRNGPIGDFKLVFRNDITKFFNYEPQPEYLQQ